MTNFVIETENLSKHYGKFVAVDKLNLKLKQGEVFGLLGPNGAGKTTTILMLLGLTDPTAGKVRVLGFDPTRQPLSVKTHVGYLPDQVGFYDNLSARENLIYIAKLNGLARQEAYQRIDQALDQVHLMPVANKQVGTFSRGMRQRLGVADVLIKKPQLIIMDEPTQGLDPEAAYEFLDLIRNLKHEGISIMLSSHLLHQVQAVCDRVSLFYQGRMVVEGAVADLAQQVLGGTYHIHLEADGPANLQTRLQKLAGVINISHPNATIYELETLSDLRAETAQAVIETGGRLLSLNMDLPNLDQIYANYFKQEAQHANAA